MYTFNSFFYPKLQKDGFSGVKRWTKQVMTYPYTQSGSTFLCMHMQVDIFTANLIMIPVHLGSHWALAVVDNQKCKVEYYDSLQYNGSPCLLKRIV